MIKHIKHAIRLIRHKINQKKHKNKRSPHWHKVQKEFLTNNPTCAACGSKERLNVHHKMPFHLDNTLELDPNNLITLCMSIDKHCHLMLGHGDDFRAYNPYVHTDAEIVRNTPSMFKAAVNRAKISRRYE